MTLRVVIADDHRIIRDGLRSVLALEKDVEVVGEAGDGRVAPAMVEQLMPDVIIMDIAMPSLNGVDATRIMARSFPGVRVIGLSTYSDKRFVKGMLDAGASGFVVKSAAAEDLVRALRAVCQGHIYLSPEVSACLLPPPISGENKRTSLSGKEREVLQLVAEGHSSKEIATALRISVKTVDTHRSNIMNRLNLHSIAALTKYAIRAGLTTLEP
jgi:DNA-binding NarL/FixJ family response regulator